MENNRDKEITGIFPVRGKIPNPVTTPTKKLFENAEISGLIKILGYNTFSKAFDPVKWKPDKLIIGTDADADGAHICCLFLLFFLKYFPFALEQGKIYVANPPLYSVPTGNNKLKYFAGTLDFIEYVQGLFMKNNSLAHSNKKAMTKQEILRFLYNNMDYVMYLEHVSNVYSIDPYLLEMLIYDKDLPYDKLKRHVEKTYKFIKVQKQNGVIIIEGLVGSLYQHIFLTDMLLNACRPVADLINKSEKFYLFNGQPCTIYPVMKAFAETEPSGMTRYKGLGEMPPERLGESTVIQGYGRTLKQYKSEDVLKEIKRLTSLQSDKGQFIKDLKVRRQDVE